MRSTFSLESDAFPDSVDDCFVATPALTHRLDLLHQLVQYGEKPLVIVAPVGSGKTMLLNRLIADAAMQWRTCMIAADPLLDPTAIVAAIGAGLELPPRGEDDELDRGLARIDTYLQSLSRSKQITLIAVDDADHLGQEARSFIDELARRWRDCNVQFLFVREPEAEDRFGPTASDPEAEKETVVVDIPPLSVEQTGDYIHTRLTHAGLEGDSPFTAEVVQSIHKSSAGRAGAIHRLARQVVSNQFPRTEHGSESRSNPASRWTRLALSLLVLSGAGAYAIHGEVERSRNAGSSSTRASEGSRPVASEPIELPTAPPSREVPETAIDRVELPVPDAVVEPTPAPKQISEAAAAELTEPDDPEPPAGAEPPADSSAFASQAPPGAVAMVETPAALSQPLVQPPEAHGTNVALVAPQALAESLPGAGNDTDVLVASTAQSRQGLRDVQWLRDKNPASYAIQIMGSRDVDALHRFASTNHLGGAAAWFATELGGRAWYVLVYGSYPSRADALQAIAKLPAALREAGPFPRTVAELLSRSTAASQ